MFSVRFNNDASLRLAQIDTTTCVSTRSVLPTYDGSIEQFALASVCSSIAQALDGEKRRVQLLFEEYCERKALNRECSSQREQAYNTLMSLVGRELADYNESAQLAVELEESRGRQVVIDTYTRFVSWLFDSVPQWIAHAKLAEHERVQCTLL